MPYKAVYIINFYLIGIFLAQLGSIVASIGFLNKQTKNCSDSTGDESFPFGMQDVICCIIITMHIYLRYLVTFVLRMLYAYLIQEYPALLLLLHVEFCIYNVYQLTPDWEYKSMTAESFIRAPPTAPQSEKKKNIYIALLLHSTIGVLFLEEPDISLQSILALHILFYHLPLYDTIFIYLITGKIYWASILCRNLRKSEALDQTPDCQRMPGVNFSTRLYTLFGRNKQEYSNGPDCLHVEYRYPIAGHPTVTIGFSKQSIKDNTTSVIQSISELWQTFMTTQFNQNILQHL
ncbi:hypothetical protein ACJX0J_023702, partial [Zea mays]